MARAWLGALCVVVTGRKAAAPLSKTLFALFCFGVKFFFVSSSPISSTMQRYTVRIHIEKVYIWYNYDA